MPRPVRNRKVFDPPKMNGFKPFGMPLCKTKSVKLQFDEYESFKLVEYDKLPQDQAAIKMEISRPTLTRIYNNALKKIAEAFVEGLAIEIIGGNVEFDKDWVKCRRCFKMFEGKENHIKCKNCPVFGKDELLSINIIKHN
jgi:uncharacterized protein